MSTMATSPEKTTSSITVRTRVWYDLTLTETGYTIKNCQTQCEAKQASSFGSYTPLMIYEYWGLSATDEGGNTVWLVSSGQTSISMGVVSTTAWSGSTPHSGSRTLTGTRGHSAKTVSLVTNHCGFKDDGASNHYSGTPVTITIPAKASYAVSFNANGGSGTPSAQTKWYNESLTITSTKPTRSGYSFIKWNTKSDGTGTDYASGSTYTGNSAITLYAIWGPIVSYNANGGTGAPAQAVKTPGTPITISTTQPTRTGYTFSKWNTSADGSGTDYSSGASYSTDAPLVLYAQWTPNTYQVSFDANTGKHAPSAINRTYGQPVTLPSAIPVKMAADFVGWATNSSGTGTLYQPGGSYNSTAVAAEILYAVWRSTYTDPAFAIDVVRTDDQGVEEDDGDHALITVLWSINPLIEPDTGESTNTATLECYMSYIDSQGHTITTEVELEDVGGTNETQGTKTSGTARALVSNIDTDTRYTIEVTIVDSRGTSVTKTEILSMAFFTMDFLAGGHGVGIGKAATREMFDVGMQTQFDMPIKVAETDVPPTFYYATKPAAADLPVRPCVVIQTSDWSVWYCDNATPLSYHQLNVDTDTVTRVKGNAESSYRTGDVNLTPANIGALNKAGDTMTGLLKFNSDSLPDDGASTDFYATGINAFSNGGRLAYKNVSDFRLWLETPRRFSFGNAGHTATYSIFARTSNNNPIGNCQATFLVSAVSSYGATVEGTYLVEVTNRGSTPTITVRCLMGIVGGNAIRFGYYRSGDYFYFGVYNPNYSGSLFFTELSNTNVTTGVLSRPSSAPSGWTPVYAGSSIAPDVLYENSSGSNGTITLSASSANYNHMRIFYRTNDGARYVESTDVYSPNGKTAQLTVPWDSGNTMYLKNRGVNISGTSIATNGSSYSECWFDSSHGRGHDNTIYITRVEAWNE